MQILKNLQKNSLTLFVLIALIFMAAPIASSYAVGLGGGYQSEEESKEGPAINDREVAQLMTLPSASEIASLIEGQGYPIIIEMEFKERGSWYITAFNEAEQIRYRLVVNPVDGTIMQKIKLRAFR